MDTLATEISEFFQDLEIPVQDLFDPNNTCSIHIFLRRALMELNVDAHNISKPQIHQAVATESALEILPQLNLLAALRYAFPTVEFGLFDLFNPTYKRRMQIIKKVMSFLKLCDYQLERLDSHASEFKAAQNMCTDLYRERERLIQDANQLALEKDKLIQRKLEIDALLNEKKRALQECYHKKTDLCNLRDKVKTEALEKEQKLEAICLDVKAHDMEIGALRQQVLTAPVVNSEAIENQMKEKEKVITQRVEQWEKIREKQKQKMQYLGVKELITEKLMDLDELIVDINKVTKFQADKLATEKEEQRLRKEKEKLVKSLQKVEEDIAEAIREKENNKLLGETEVEEQRNAVAQASRAYYKELQEYNKKNDEQKAYEHEIKNYEEKIELLKVNYKSALEEVWKVNEQVAKKEKELQNLAIKLKNLSQKKS